MTKPPTALLAPKPRRLALVSLVIAGCAFLIAACGGSPNDAAVAHLGTTTTNTPRTQGSGSPSNSNSGPSAGGGPAGGQSSFSMAGGNESTMLAYAHCMQTHGVPNFPEPNGQGVVQGNGLNPGSPSFQAADKDCRHLLPNGGQATPAQQAQAMAQALKMSQCMRAHGIRDFPDPQTGPGGGIAIRLHSTPGSDLNPQNPQFQAAQNACGGILGAQKNGKFGGPKTASGGEK